MELPALSRQEVRRVDQVAIETYGIPGIVLMENAGRGAAAVIDRVAHGGRIAILCGRGNNAGDGYVIARHLQLAGRDVQLISLADPQDLRGDAQVNAHIAQQSAIPLRWVATAESLQAALVGATTIVDGLLGTGASGPPRDLFAEAVRVANGMDAVRIALDIPTGLDCDSGEAHDPTFRADHTTTFVAAKIGFNKKHADDYVGVVHVIGIGIPKKMIDEMLLGQP